MHTFLPPTPSSSPLPFNFLLGLAPSSAAQNWTYHQIASAETFVAIAALMPLAQSVLGSAPGNPEAFQGMPEARAPPSSSRGGPRR